MHNQIHDLFVKALEQIENTDIDKLEITAATNAKFGDLQTNVAMQHAKLLRKSPLQIAELIVSMIPENNIIDKVEVVKPGFINVFLSTEFINQSLHNVFNDEHLGIPQLSDAPCVVMDFSSPNVAKTMHIAHIRSTIIGDALRRIYSACGCKVIADNHLGDWGTQFGKLIYAWNNFEKPSDKEGVELLESLYQEFVRKAEEDDTLNDHARAELAKLQKKEEPNYSLWQEFIQMSLKEFHQIYDELDVHFDTEHGESFYNDELPGVIDALKEKDLCKESDGAQVVFFPEDEFPPYLVQKKDGSFLYATTDIATIQHRRKNYNPQQAIYITDSRQSLHFRQLFRVSELLGYDINLNHVAFGMMKFEEGAVMSTRKGNVIRLRDFIDEAQRRAKLEIRDNGDYSDEEKDEIARVVGIGAIKYQDLSQNPASDITFTWDKALSMDGNSAPYLQIAYARVQGIKRRYAENFGELDLSNAKFHITHDLEKALALQIFEFGNVVHQARKSNKPNLIADYVYQLASKYASFYSGTPPVLKEQDVAVREGRVLLSDSTARIISRGLSLLGIQTLDRM
jgi:arginyl-tRNA synthetase